MQKLLEPQIKAMVINKLLGSKRAENGDVIINEFTIDKSSRRVDLALISDNKLEAFEIKSEADSLSRIEGQTSKYLEYFDKVTIVSAEKHCKYIKRLFGDEVGLWEVKNGKIKVIKRGRKKTIKEKEKIISLMTVTELKKLARTSGLKPIPKRRKDLEILVRRIQVHELRDAALQAVKRRYQVHYDNFSTKTLGRNISAEDIKLLSPSRKNNRKNLKDQSIESLILGLESI